MFFGCVAWQALPYSCGVVSAPFLMQRCFASCCGAIAECGFLQDVRSGMQTTASVTRVCSRILLLGSVAGARLEGVARASLEKTWRKHHIFKHWSSVMTSYTRAPPKIDGESVFERVFMVVSDSNQNVELRCELGIAVGE